MSVSSTKSGSSQPAGESFKVFINHFPPFVTKRDIQEHLKVCAVSSHVKSITIFYKATNVSRGCGYVEYAPASAGQMAVFKLNGSKLFGTHRLQAKEFRVNRSKSAMKVKRRGKKEVNVQPLLIPAEHPASQEDSESDDSFKLFVGSLSSAKLPNSIKSSHLTQHFKDFNPSSAFILIDKDNNQSKGCGFVYFRSKSEAQVAIDRMHGSTLHGCKVKVELARKKMESTSSDSGAGTRGKIRTSSTRSTSDDHLASPKSKGQAKAVNSGHVFSNKAVSGSKCPSGNKSNTSTSRVSMPLAIHDDKLPMQVLPPTSTKAYQVFVGSSSKPGLPQSVKEQHIANHFREFQPAILNVSIARHKDTSVSKGYGFILFSSNEAAQKAIRKLHGSHLAGCTLKVQYNKREQKSMTPLVESGSKIATAKFEPLPSLLQAVVSPSDTISISNLNPAIGEDELSSLCGGTISYIHVEADGPNINKAEIRFSSISEAQDAISRINGKDFLGSTVSAVHIYPPTSRSHPSRSVGKAITHRVKVTNISPATSKSTLIQQFQSVSKVIECQVIALPNPHALIDFKQECDADKAVKIFNEQVFDGYKITVRKEKSIPCSNSVTTVFVSDLNPQLQIEEHRKALTAVFSLYHSATIVNVNSSHAFVSFSNADEAQKATTHLHHSIIGGSRVQVEIQPSRQYNKHPSQSTCPE